MDPASYYAQYYRSGADSDGRVSPFPSAGATTKYNGNVGVLPAPNSQSPQEVCTDIIANLIYCEPTTQNLVLKSKILSAAFFPFILFFLFFVFKIWI